MMFLFLKGGIHISSLEGKSNKSLKFDHLAYHHQNSDVTVPPQTNWVVTLGSAEKHREIHRKSE